MKGPPGRKGRRVLIIVQNLPVPRDRRVWLECQALVAAGYQVSVVCPKAPGDPDEHTLEGVLLRKYDPPPPASSVRSYLVEFVLCWLRTARRVLQAFTHEGFDVIQTCNPPDTYWALAAPFRLLGRKFVYDQHDLCPEVYLSRFDRHNRLLLRGLYLLERGNYRVADHVIVPNESYRDVAVRRGGRRPSEVTVVRSGPDDKRFKTGEPVPALRRGRKHLAVYVGVMGPQDGVDRAVWAADAYVHKLGRTDCQFVLLGSGDCRAELCRLVDELDLAQFVEVPGWADDATITAYLSTAAVGLSPDPPSPLNAVSTMNKTLEYMAFGVPLVSFDLAETRFSAQDAAVYVEGEDVEAFAAAIAGLIDDSDERARRGKAGRQRIEEQLAWSHQRADYVGVYDRLSARERRPS